MSNKRQLKMSLSKRPTFVLRKLRNKHQCDLSILGAFLCSLLLMSSMLCITSAKLEEKTEHNQKPETEIKLQSQTDGTTEKVFSHSNDDSEQNANQLDYEHFYRSELKRLPYETINRILRDEQEPIFRSENIDLRYYHTRSLQPTHEVVRRSAEEIAPMVHSLNLRGQNLSELSTTNSTIQNYDAIDSIDLSLNILKTIKLNDFKNLLTVNLSHNRFVDIPITSNSTFEQLNLNSNNIQKAQGPHNDHLRILYLSDNKIENLTALNLSLLNALETLDLSCNLIRNLETTFFPRLMHNLKYLNLAHNQLGSISRETFYNLLSLNTLLLAHNSITYIDYETFLSLPNLQYLDLSYNQLKGESIRALQGIPDLVGLSIAYNPEMGESLQEFVASWSLKEVDASGTGLCQIPAALAQAVRTLKLADNWFKIINCGDLDSYPLLQHLDLSYSHIEDIEDDAMGRLEFLEVLFLDHNQLHKVPVSLPTSLEHLFLQNNEIMDLQVPTFQGLKNLKTLDLSHNKLLYLPALPLPKLLTLNLQASGLQGLNQAIVHSLPHLRDLLLEENPIKCSDLLGIAEWASPCRIADRSSSTSKDIDGEQIANLYVGQQQLQTVAKIDLKQKFVETHNFYEKFTSVGGICSNLVGRQMSPVITPPSCAVELDEDVEEVEKSKSTGLEVIETSATIAEGQAEQQELFSPVQHETTTQLTNVHSNESRIVYENSLKTSDVDKKSQSLTMEMSTDGKVIAKNKNFTVMVTAVKDNAPTVKTNQRRYNNTKPLSSQVATEKTQITNIIIENTATATESNEFTKLKRDMTKTTSPTITTRQKSVPTTAKLVPTTLITSTLVLGSDSNETQIEKTTTTTTNTGIWIPQTMSTTMATTTTILNNNVAAQHSGKTLISLLERQRRVEAEQTTMTTTGTTIPDKTLPTKPATEKFLELMNNINNDSDVKDEEQIFFKNQKNSTTITGVEVVKPKVIATTSPVVLKRTTTQNQTQHKHVTLQLHVKDRHLIGTPLLTHHGQNILVAAEDIQDNQNHMTTKTIPYSPKTIAKSTETETETTEKTYKTNVTGTSNEQKLDKSQKERLKIHSKLVSNDDNINGNKNHVDFPTQTTTTKEFIGKHSLTPTPTTTMRTPMKTVKKPQHEQVKKKPSLTMKKMTITTKHASPTSTPKESQQHQTTHQQPHHHYTLNIPRENEATLLSKSAAENLVNTNSQTISETLIKPPFHHGNIKHSTVNTPIISGQKHELQTFQEHNELEEAAAAAAHSAHAHASTSAIISKISKTGSTTTSTSAKWFDLRKTTATAAHPGIVILLSFGLFVVLLIGLLHVYRCDIPWPLRHQRHQQHRPHRMHHHHQQQQQQQLQKLQQQHLQQQTNFNDDDGHSFLSYQSNCSNQFNQRKWRLQATHKKQITTLQQHQHQHQEEFQQQEQHKQQHSPFHNLQVRELQQTSAIETGPKYAKQTYKISSALGERSSSQTSSSCSPHSSDIFDDETFCIEMTTDVGQTINDEAGALPYSELLPMELLNVSKRNIGKSDEKLEGREPIDSDIFQTSSIDENFTIQSSSKLTPTTRKLGIW